ncbi:unnamed protein product, partial [Mesorhabditis belari]|uniref:Uncharacterized protein n=1 Tax=Mesorhabditis belari TaxID=2138241 RepID=A0AAF3EZE5_9BILA
MIVDSAESSFKIQTNQVKIPRFQKHHWSSIPQSETIIFMPKSNRSFQSLQTFGESHEKMNLRNERRDQNDAQIESSESTQLRLIRGQGDTKKDRFLTRQHPNLRVRISRPIRPSKIWEMRRKKMKRIYKDDELGNGEIDSFRPPPLPPLPNEIAMRISGGNFRRRLKRPCYRNREPRCGLKLRKTIERNVANERSKGAGIARKKRS